MKAYRRAGVTQMRKVFGWIIALCGLWEFGDVVAPFIPGFGTVRASVWNHIIIGAILLIVGAWAALTRSAGTAKTMDWIAAVAGGWLIIASFILGNPTADVGLWNDIIVGVIVVILGAWAALAAPSTNKGHE
jgi:hypothetical protein